MGTSWDTFFWQLERWKGTRGTVQRYTASYSRCRWACLDREEEAQALVDAVWMAANKEMGSCL